MKTSNEAGDSEEKSIKGITPSTGRWLSHFPFRSYTCHSRGNVPGADSGLRSMEGERGEMQKIAMVMASCAAYTEGVSCPVGGT